MKKREFTDMIVIHCSATKPSDAHDLEDVRRWHVDDNEWGDVGYHWVITVGGIVQKGRDEWRQGAHEPSANDRSVAICLIGGMNEEDHPKWVNNFSVAQMDALKELVTRLKKKYRIADHNIVGHRDLGVNKACPCFDVQDWWKNARQDQQMASSKAEHRSLSTKASTSSASRGFFSRISRWLSSRHLL